MATKIQIIQNYIGYIKCGEILKSPVQNYQNPFVLKCFQCDDIHFLLESFIIHIQEHSNDAVSARERIETTTANVNTIQDEVGRECVGEDNLTIKLEDNAMEMEDPLIVVKNEKEAEESTVKEEYKLQQTEVVNSNYVIDQFDDFEDATLDSPDELLPDDTETEEDEIINKTPNKRKINSTPVVDKFMESKINVSTLIEAYKNQPNLWNKDSSLFRLKDKRQEFLQEITLELNSKLKLNLIWNEVAEIIAHICSKHRDIYRRLDNHKENDKNGKIYKRCWYFEDLDFLRSKKIIQLEKLDSQLPELTPEQIIKILNIYQSFTQLWNSNLIEYICTNKRNDAHSEMLKILETEMNLKVSKTALEEYLRTVHSYFSKEKRLQSNSPRKKSDRKTMEISSPDYYEHLAFLYDHEGPFTCGECKRILTKPLCFKVHKSQHDGSMPLKCSECNKDFKTLASYTTHAKRHFEDLVFVCKECDKKFLNNNDLKVHMLTHTGDRPYCCEICGAAYRHVQCFKKHQRRHEKRFSHTCHICSKGYYSKDRYDDHMNSHMNIRSHICKICGRGFITSRALKTHAVTHEDVRNHACQLCGKTFKLKIGVLQHMRTHGNKVEFDEN